MNREASRIGTGRGHGRLSEVGENAWGRGVGVQSERCDGRAIKTVTEDVADEAGKAQRHAAKRGNEGTRIKGKTELIAKYRKGATSEYMCVPELRPVTVSPPLWRGPPSRLIAAVALGKQAFHRQKRNPKHRNQL